VPPQVAGLTVHFQAVQQHPVSQQLHWTNVQVTRVVP
jgi:hypothetical protein